MDGLIVRIAYIDGLIVNTTKVDGHRVARGMPAPRGAKPVHSAMVSQIDGLMVGTTNIVGLMLSTTNIDGLILSTKEHRWTDS